MVRYRSLKTGRATIYGHSATSIFKWMGMNDWTLEDAWKVVVALGLSDQVKLSTIQAGVADGKNPKYQTQVATPTTAQIAKLEQIRNATFEFSNDFTLKATPPPLSGNLYRGDNSEEAEKWKEKCEALSHSKNELAIQIDSLNEKLQKTEQDLKVAKKGGPRIIKLMRHDGKTKTIKDHTHPAFEEVIQLASMRMNIFLPGPAGCGKSHLAFQIAKSLGLKFYSISCTSGMSEGQLTGRLLPIGKNGQFEYVLAEYVKAYEQGGVFLCDEIDAADPNVMLVLNTSLANGHLPLPNRPENPVATKHKDFVFIAAANTFGRGADRLYVGRNQLDEATIDRFRIGTVEMDYDDGAEAEDKEWKSITPPYHFAEKMKAADGLETQLCPNEDLRILLQWYRHKVRENRLERIISTRFMEQACKMVEKAKWTIEKIEEKLFSGWSEDEIRKVRMEY